MKCTTCNENVGNQALRLVEPGYGVKQFCSFECLIEYSVAQLLQRWRGQINRVWRLTQQGKERVGCRPGYGSRMEVREDARP